MRDEKVMFTKEMIVVLEVTWNIANNKGWMQSGSLFELIVCIVPDNRSHYLSQRFSDGKGK